jgi:hypothetical protein
VTKELWGDKHVYAPSWEEQQAITAIINKQDDTAQLWFDRAIIADPSCGARAFNLCTQLKSPVSGAFIDLDIAVHRRDLKAYQHGVERIIARHPELSVNKEDCLEKAAQYLEDLSKRAPIRKEE